MNYSVLGKDNKVFGPYPLEKLNAFIEMGKLKGNMILIDETGKKYYAKTIFPQLDTSNSYVDLTEENSNIDTYNNYSQPAEITYRLIAGDGNSYGPYTKQELQSFVSERRVMPESLLVSSEGFTIHAGNILTFPIRTDPEFHNDSGQGAYATLPPDLRGLNWGAFMFSWLWGINHKCWITLLCFIPYVNIVMQFILLFKGNEWAWQNRRWRSKEEFREVQSKWTWWILWYLLICFGLGILSVPLAFI